MKPNRRLSAAVLASAALAAAVSLPAGAAAPTKSATYGGGTLSGFKSTVTIKVAKSGKALSMRARVLMTCGGTTDYAAPVDFFDVKIGRDDTFSAKVDGTSVTGKFDGGHARGTLKATRPGCKTAKAKWGAAEPGASRRGGKRRAGDYFGTNPAIQDVFNAEGAAAPFMLRVSDNGRYVTRAFMRTEWGCEPGGETFDDQYLTRRFRIAKDGTFGRSYSTRGTGSNGQVTLFTTQFKGKVARGKVTGTWREAIEQRPSAGSETVTRTCDTGKVRFTGLR